MTHLLGSDLFFAVMNSLREDARYLFYFIFLFYFFIFFIAVTNSLREDACYLAHKKNHVNCFLSLGLQINHGVFSNNEMKLVKIETACVRMLVTWHTF